MRIWVKPDRLATLGVTVSEVVNAVQTQNTVNPAGQVGGEPTVQGQQFTYTVRAQGRLTTPEEFGDIVIRESAAGGVVRVRDVASIELGSQDYNIATRLNGKPAAVLGIYQLPGSNAVEAAKGVRKLMAEMEQKFPADLEYAITLDTTEAVLVGIEEIVITLVIAFVLVILVVYVFLQDWRATLIPMLAVPVSLVGTFMVFPFFGFSVNTLSLFGLVLAIGLVVDDAIVVVEGHSAAHRRGPGAEGRRPEGDGRIVRAGDWYRPRPGRGVRADRLHPGHHRQALSAVCHHHRDLRPRLGVQRPDVEPCARRAPAPAASEGSWSRGPVLRLVQPCRSSAPPTGTCGCRARSSARAPSPSWHSWRLRQAACSSRKRCRRASCPTRTRATCTSRCSCRRRRPSRPRPKPPAPWKKSSRRRMASSTPPPLSGSARSA